MNSSLNEIPSGGIVEKWNRKDVAWLAVLLLAFQLLVAIHTFSYRTVSPIDETQHIDYLLRVASLDLPRPGEYITEKTMREVACRGLDPPGTQLPACDSENLDPTPFPETGLNSAAVQEPTYYGITAVVARAIVLTTPVSSLVTAGRLVGGLWAAIAMLLIWEVGRLLGAHRMARAAGVLLCVFNPMVLFHSSTINPDASLIFAGAFAVFTFMKFDRGELPAWVLLPTVFFLYSLDRSIILIVGVLVPTVFLGAMLRHETKKMVWIVAVFFLVAVSHLRLMRLIHGIFQPSIPSAPESPMSIAFRVDTVDWAKVIGQVPRVLTPLRYYYPARVLNYGFLGVVGEVLDRLIIAGLVCAAVVGSRQIWKSVLPVLTLLAMSIAGPLYTFSYAYFSKMDFSATGRFGLCLLPSAAVCIALGLKSRASRIVIFSIGFANSILLFYFLIFGGSPGSFF